MSVHIDTHSRFVFFFRGAKVARAGVERESNRFPRMRHGVLQDERTAQDGLVDQGVADLLPHRESASHAGQHLGGNCGPEVRHCRIE
jgi:hypothetical protein